MQSNSTLLSDFMQNTHNSHHGHLSKNEIVLAYESILCYMQVVISKARLRLCSNPSPDNVKLQRSS